jgi:hypothetical protein
MASGDSLSERLREIHNITSFQAAADATPVSLRYLSTTSGWMLDQLWP